MFKNELFSCKESIHKDDIVDDSALDGVEDAMVMSLDDYKMSVQVGAIGPDERCYFSADGKSDNVMIDSSNYDDENMFAQYPYVRYYSA